MRPIIKKMLLIIGLAFVLSLAIDAYRLFSQSPQNIPADAFVTINQSLGNNANTEKHVVIYAWASWCALCSVTTPQVKWLQALYPTTSIAVQSGDDAKVAQYIKSKNIQFPVINDNDGLLANSLNIKGTPTFIIASNTGKVHYYSVGVSFLPSLLLKLFIIDVML